MKSLTSSAHAARGKLRVWTSFLALAALVGGRGVAAEPVRIPTRLEWGASVCGDARGFTSRVLQRTQRVRFVERREELTASLSIEPKGTGLEARVVLTAAGRQIMTRSIASPDCDDALDALALVLAISLEARSQEVERARAKPRRPVLPRARSEAPPAVKAPEPPAVGAQSEAIDAPELTAPPVSEPAESSEPTPSVPQVSEPGAADAMRESPEEPAAESSVAASRGAGTGVSALDTRSVAIELTPGGDRVAERDPALDERDAAREPAVRSGLHFGAGVSADAAFGIAPSMLFGGSVWVRSSYEQDSILSPAVIGSFSHLERDRFERGTAEIDFALDAGRVSLCPLRFGGSGFELRPCAHGSLGRLAVDSRAPFFSRDVKPWWAAAGGSFEALMRIGLLELRAVVALDVPLARDGLRIGPRCSGSECQGDAFHTVWALTPTFGAGAGMGF